MLRPYCTICKFYIGPWCSKCGGDRNRCEIRDDPDYPPMRERKPGEYQAPAPMTDFEREQAQAILDHPDAKFDGGVWYVRERRGDL